MMPSVTLSKSTSMRLEELSPDPVLRACPPVHADVRGPGRPGLGQLPMLHAQQHLAQPGVAEACSCLGGLLGL